MNQALADYLIAKINWHRTWLKAMDFGSEAMTVYATGSGVKKRIVKVFRLEVRVSMNDYPRGAIIRVSERRLDESLSNLSDNDKGFRQRLNTLSLTFIDINRLFSIATWGAINLGLEA